MPRQLLNGFKEETSQPLGNVFQCSVTCIVKEFLRMFRRKLLCFLLYPLPLVLSLLATEERLAQFLHHHFKYWMISSKPSLFWAEQSQLFQHFVMGEMLQFICCLPRSSPAIFGRSMSFFVLESPELDSALHASPHQG